MINPALQGRWKASERQKKTDFYSIFINVMLIFNKRLLYIRQLFAIVDMLSLSCLNKGIKDVMHSNQDTLVMDNYLS
jgi:hypothetical protein